MSRLSYFFLDSKGLCSLPSADEIKKSELDGKPFILVLDNNVHIDILNYSSLKEEKKARVNDLLDYYNTCNIALCPDYALLEYASDRKTLKLDIDKFNKSKNAFLKSLIFILLIVRPQI